MGAYQEIEEHIRKSNENLMRFANRVLEELNKETSKAVGYTKIEFGKYQERVLTDLFRDAVDDFYNSYQPVDGGYIRQFGLYDTLDIKWNSDGTVYISDDYTSLFDGSKMHGDRKGGDLFNKVFMQGWHGGAESGPGHPDPASGTPYWRTPIGYYGSWGSQAERSDVSPYDKIAGEMPAILSGKMFQEFDRLCHVYNDIAVKKVTDNISKYRKEIYG